MKMGINDFLSVKDPLVVMTILLMFTQVDIVINFHLFFSRLSSARDWAPVSSLSKCRHLIAITAEGAGP